MNLVIFLGNSIGKPQPRDSSKYFRNSSHKTFEKGKTNPARPPDEPDPHLEPRALYLWASAVDGTRAAA